MKIKRFLVILLSICLILGNFSFYPITKVYGYSNIALGILPASSSTLLNKSSMTDGDKSGSTYAYSNSGLKWVQLDLGSSYDVSEIKLWHYFGDKRQYHDVVVQLSSDPTFPAGGISTVFNNDSDNTSGLGAGTDSEYQETSDGKDITFGAVSARYVRIYGNGSTVNGYTHYVEVEVYGSLTVFHPATVSLNKTSSSLLVGAIDQLEAVVLPENAAEKGVTWSSSDPSVATVSSTGLVTGVSLGTAVVTATTVDGGLTASCQVAVTQVVHPQSVTLNKTTDQLTAGGTDQLTATVLPEGTTDKSVTWTSSDPSVATVSSTGLVTGVGEGTAAITATTVDGGLTAACTVKVMRNAALGISPTSSSTLLNKAYMTDGNKTASLYTSTNTSLNWVQLDLGSSYDLVKIKLWHYFGDKRKYHDVVVQLSNDPTFSAGVITTVFNNDSDNSTGLGAGADSEYEETSEGKDISFSAASARYVRIYGKGSTVNGYTHYVEVEVYGSKTVAHPQSISLNKAADLISTGGTDQLTATVLPEYSSDKSVTWTSSDPSVAAVSSTGLVTGMSEGTAVVTATTVDGALDASCTVKVMRNLALGISPTSSSTLVNKAYMTDGDKTTSLFASTNTNLNWVQLDLGSSYDLVKIKLWHYFGDKRKYHDVVVQLSNDPTFSTGVVTVFNNDSDNSTGLGAGADSEYEETSAGKDISFSASSARCVRIYGKGSTVNGYTHYVEVEVNGTRSLIHPQSVSLSKTTDFLSVGGTDQLSATVLPENSTDKSVTWTSSDPAVATVSSTGLVAGVSEGSTVVTATTVDGALSATCTVTVRNNIALGKPPSYSTTLLNKAFVTDGDKTTSNYASSGSGLNWVQLYIGPGYDLNKIKLWHYFGDKRKYHDVVVQISNDATFSTGVVTVFNNDSDNSTGLGAGTDSEYEETSAGKEISFSSTGAQFVRIYGNGSSVNAYTHYVEIEVYGDRVSLPTTTAQILFTFDDGPKTDLNVAAPILAAKGFKGTSYVCKNYALYPSAADMTVAEMNSLYVNYGWDISNHTVNHNSIPTYPLNPAPSMDYLKASYLENQNWILSNGWTRGAYHVAYPFGSYNAELVDYLKTIAQTARTAVGGVQPVPVANKYEMLALQLRNDNMSEVYAAIDEAVSTGSTLFLTMHTIDDTTYYYSVSPAKFQQIVDYVYSYQQQGKVEVKTISEWYSSNQ